MGTGTEKKGYLEDAFVNPEAFGEKWKLSAADVSKLREKHERGQESIGEDDLDSFLESSGLSVEGKKSLRLAWGAHSMGGLPPAPPRPPDLTDELLVKSRMAQDAETRSAKGLSSTFLVGKTKVGG